MVAGGSVGAVRRVDLSRLEPILRHLFGWLDADGRQVELDIPAEDVPEEREGLGVAHVHQHDPHVPEPEVGVGAGLRT